MQEIQIFNDLTGFDMDLIHQNPFRILGLPVTATDREIAKSISDLSIFMEMGKAKEFDCDYFFPVKPCRTSEALNAASQRVEQPKNKLFYALFWFWENSANTIDEMAFEELKNGNVDKAVRFWEKATANGITTKNSSNHKNLAVLYLGLSSENNKLDKSMFLKSVSLSGKFLANGHFEEFIKHVVGPKHSIDSLEIIDSYVDKIISLAKPYLDIADGLKTRELIKNFSCYSDDIQHVILDKFIGKHIHNIDHQIKNAESWHTEDETKANKAGFELFEKTKEDLEYLRTVLSESDLEYQLIADKLANEIIECSIRYFNEFRDSEIDPGDDAVKLAKHAKSIAVGEKVNERIDEGMPILTEYVKDKPKREKLKQVKKEVNYIEKAIEGLINIKLAGPDHAANFVANCKKKLVIIRDKFGRSDNDYLELCDMVVNVAINTCLQPLNAMAGESSYYIRQHIPDAKNLIIGIKSTIGYISQIDMSTETRNKYNELCTKLGISKSSFCYIATMVYSSYNAPEVMVLRKFRDEVLQQSKIGRKFVKIYYKYSPSLVKKIKDLKIIHLLIKALLDPFVKYLRAKDE